MLSSIQLCLALLVSAPGGAMRVYPDRIQLDGNRDSQAVIVQWVTANGVTHDVTAEVEWTLDDAQLCDLQDGHLTPKQSGGTALRLRYRGQEAVLPVEVKHVDSDPPISFRKELMPILMKAGCNSGRCHGAARGKDGFQLSLFGFDPEGDHYRLTKELIGRRVNLSRPEASLLLTKALGNVAHTGGERFSEDDAFYETMVRWIQEGANDDQDLSVVPVGIEVYPHQAVLAGKEAQQQLSVLARYSDGSDRDVTDLAVFMTNNDNSADVSEAGMVTAGAPGEAFLMARFETFTEGVPFVVLPDDADFEPVLASSGSYIDALIVDKLNKLRIEPSEVCEDEEFLRRVFIDLVGSLPDYERYEEFTRDTNENKREALIDELLARPEFVDLWTMRFGELLKIRTANQVSYKALVSFHDWLHERLSNEVPLDEIIRDVIQAQGGTFSNPPTNYYQIEANNLQLTENVAQAFMGMRIQCAQCHNHPFDRWTMDDYYGFAAFFSQIGFKQSQDPREFIIHNSGMGETRHIVDNRVVAPKFLGGETPSIDAETDRRAVLADWIVSDDNPYFARNLANLVWSHHFGRGIIEPVDDVRISNPPSNPELLEELGQRFASSGFNLRALVKDICMSDTYQRSTQSNATNANDLSNFSHAQVRRIRAEVLLDSITSLTHTDERYPRLPVGARAVQIPDGAVSNYFLSTFGRAPRETVCSCEVNVEPTLSQAFHLMNGDATNDRIQEGQFVRKLLDQGQSRSQIIERLYVTCLCRKPSPQESESLLAAIDARDPEEAINDIFWALLNSKEFLFNH